MPNQLVIIGMDGADPDLARRWASEGRLPALQSLLERGRGGVLWSTPNAMSPAAWSSFATGLNPGRHGVFYFLDRKPGTYELMHAGSRTREGLSFWRAASEAGKRVCLLHEPMTFPAEPVNGVQVCGWLAPGMNAPGFAHPPELVRELREKVPEYVLHTGMTEFIRRGRHDLALAKKLQSVRAKGKLARWLYGQEDWDVFVTVFDETDPISHYFWHFMDEGHPEHQADTAARYDEAILDTYRTVDEEIGKLLEQVPDSAHVFVLSDHGSCRNSRGALYLKGLLREMGLEVGRAGKRGAAGLAHGLAEKLLPSKAKHWAAGKLPGLAARLLETSAAGDIDFTRSRAYTFWCNGCAEPWFNRAGRDPSGLVTDAEAEDLTGVVREALLAASEAGTGAPLVRSVQSAAEVYQGPHLNRAPDLLVNWTDTVVQTGLRTSFGGRSILVPEPCAEELRRGNHRREGLLIAAGPRISTGATPPDISLLDLAPTFLAMLGVPTPGKPDGRARGDLIADLQATEAAAVATANQDTPYSAEDEALVEERLKDLGYL